MAKLYMICPDCGGGDFHGHYCPKKPKQSDLELAVLYRGGCTLQEIGDAIGLTRERVRQRLTRIGMNKTETGWHSVDLTRIDAHPAARQALGINQTRKLAKREATKAAIIAALQRIYARTKTPPRLLELAAEMGWPARFPAEPHRQLRSAFAGDGLLREITPARAAAMAYLAAGVPQPKPGRDYGTTPSFVQHWNPRRDTCKKGGHPKRRTPKGQSYCPICRKAAHV